MNDPFKKKSNLIFGKWIGQFSFSLHPYKNKSWVPPPPLFLGDFTPSLVIYGHHYQYTPQDKHHMIYMYHYRLQSLAWQDVTQFQNKKQNNKYEIASWYSTGHLGGTDMLFYQAENQEELIDAGLFMSFDGTTWIFLFKNCITIYICKSIEIKARSMETNIQP